jgi:hypothetical protein
MEDREICDACYTKLERWIELQERHDEGGIGVPASPKEPSPVRSAGVSS